MKNWKKIFISIIAIILISGCTLQKTETKESVDQGMSDAKWQEFNSKGTEVFTTKDWSSFSIAEDKFSFSIKYPDYWKLHGSVFYDAGGNKIAELSPGLIVLQPGQTCFDGVEIKYEMSELLSKTNVSIGGRQGVLEIEKTNHEERGYWYPNVYCIMGDKTALIMAFYEDKLNTGDKKLFEKILSTIKFEQQKAQEKFDIFGGAKFDTIVEGYLKTQEEDTLGGRTMRAYLVITKFQDEKLRESIEDGIKGGNGVNKKENNLYLFNLGCFEDRIIGGFRYEKEQYIDEETQKVLLGSAADKPVNIKLYFDYHDGMGCGCCNLAHKVRVVK